MVNDLVPYGLAAIFYAIAAFLASIHWVQRQSRWGRWANYALGVGAICHGVAVILRWTAHGGLPAFAPFESISFFTWVMVVIYLAVQGFYGLRVLNIFVAPIALIFLALALAFPYHSRPLPPVLQASWTEVFPIVHVVVSLAAYAFFTLACVAAVVYLLQDRQLKAKSPHSLYQRLPSLEMAQHLCQVMVSAGFPALVVTMITGAIWSNQAWGSPWLWEGKQGLSLVMLLIYVFYLHTRNIAGWPARRTAWLLIVGFVSVLVTFLGATLLAPGQHQFG
ncbi:MAG: hypothetical protein EPO21_05600 [Chloroflexota bacterium]|nr:MAG: hypothetical protein EPO21_05600 [Chloroflexota bacterium]